MRDLRRSALLALALIGGCAGDAPDRAAPRDVALHEPYRYPTAALAWPGATRAFQVTSAGDLYNGEWQVRFSLSANQAPADSPRVIGFEGGWRPVARWTRQSGPLRWEFEGFACPSETARPWWSRLSRSPSPPADSGLWVSVEVTVVNSSPAACAGRIAARLVTPDRDPSYIAPELPGAPDTVFRWAAGDSARAHGWSDLDARDAEAAASFVLPAGGSRRVRFVFPAYATPSRALSAWSRTSHPRRREAVRAYWDREVAKGARFDLGDPDVERALDAARVTLLTCRERRGDAWYPIGSPLQYRDVWIRDGARAIQALALLGRTQESRALARSLLEFQLPLGCFVSQRGQLDGSGQALWVFDQAFSRPAFDDSVADLADASLRAIHWLEWMRERGRESGWVYGAMLPAVDPRDNENVLAQLVGNDAWAIAGYQGAARLLRAAGRASEAQQVEASRQRYVDEFVAALDRSGSPDIPPSWQGVGRDWGNLAVSYPCRVLAASDARLERLARRVWRPGGGAGLCAFARGESLHFYVGADLAQWALLAGQSAAADSVLSAMTHWTSASGGAAEYFSRAGDFGGNYPHHVTSAAVYATLVRNCLIFDESDTLGLTLGARAPWWNAGSVRRAPTRWGLLDLSFRSQAGRAEWQWTPVPVWTSLTLPPGAELSSPPPPPAIQRSATTVLVPPGTGQLTVATRTASR